MDLSINYIASLSYCIPEAIALLTMVGLVFLESTYSRDEKRNMVFYFSLFGLLGVIISLSLNLSLKPTSVFYNAIKIDPFSTTMKLVMSLGTLGAIYLSKVSADIYKNLKSEYIIMAVGVLIGGMLLASANNLLTVYLGIETLSILSYVMASFKKNEERSSEAGLKYVLYGGVSAGIMLFGMSHIFGVVGTIQFNELVIKLESLSSVELAVLLPSFLMFFTGLGYKIACVPFHMWSPDVYEGSPIPVTTFFAIVPKLAGIAAVIRVTFVIFATNEILQNSWVGLLVTISVLTMTVGNVAAIGQQSVKRMLAYSSIAHAGYMLMGAVVLDQVGASAVVFYGITYIFMTLVAFYIVSFVSDKYGNDHFDRFGGLIIRYPFMAIMMTVAMLSLAGVPPLAGFVAKFNLLSAVLAKKYYGLAIIAGLNSVISLYYYLKIVRIMVFKPVDSEDKIEGFSFGHMSLITMLTLPIFILGIFWEKIYTISKSSTIFF